MVRPNTSKRNFKKRKDKRKFKKANANIPKNLRDRQKLKIHTAKQTREKSLAELRRDYLGIKNNQKRKGPRGRL